MPRHLQFPADFNLWRLPCIACGLGLILLGFRILLNISAASGYAAVGPALMGLCCLIGAAIFIAPQIVGYIARPVTFWFDRMFYPTETLREPPAALLVSLRARLRDRQWKSVTQQIDALESSYGPSPELSHLRAHLVAGRTGDFKIVTAAAAATLSARAFDRYTVLLRRDPPPVESQTGMDS